MYKRQVEAKKACEILDFKTARWHRTLLLTNAGVDLDAPWIPYDLFYLARILIKLQEWDKARERFEEALERFERVGFPKWRTACLSELEWLGDINLLKKREDLWMNNMRALKMLEWVGYHRWMHRTQISRLERSSLEEFRLDHLFNT